MLLGLERRITSANILFFDMDGTLIDSDYANFLAYVEAVRLVLDLDIRSFCTPAERFTRESVKRIIPGITSKNLEEIIHLKDENYTKCLPTTKVSRPVGQTLIKYSETNTTVLVTNCRKKRASTTLKHHNLLDHFNHNFYRENLHSQNKFSKYICALTVLDIDPTLVFAFENEKQEIDAAVFAGIPVDNIIAIS